MDILESIFSLVLTLGILVTIHEYGHFWVARRCGVVVLKFSVGFGKSIYSWKDKHGTEFTIAWIPLGGYVKMLDEREAPVVDELKPYAFNRKPVSQRIAIASAGPIANFLFAIFAYWLMFLSGFNVLIPTVGSVDENSISSRAGIESGYEIVAVDGRETPGWRAVNMELINRIGDTGKILVSATVAPGLASKDYSLDIDQWMQGKEPSSLLSDLGLHIYRPQIEAKIGRVVDDSPAQKGGLMEGDHIFRVNGKQIDSWSSFAAVIHQSAEKIMRVDVYRMSEQSVEEVVNLSIKPEIHINEAGGSEGRIGIAAKSFTYPDEMIREVSYGPITSISYAASQVWADTKMTLNAIKKMASGLISLDNLSGPITIAQVASDSIRSGSEAFLRFLALLSVSLGILNLLPIPVLDGGHILYYVIEGLRGKPLSEKLQLAGLKIGVSFILVLMSLAFYNDVMRLQ